MEDSSELPLFPDDSFSLLNYAEFPQIFKEEPYEYADGIFNEDSMLSQARLPFLGNEQHSTTTLLMSADSTVLAHDSVSSILAVPIIPSATSRLPCTDEFSGECEFYLEISSETAGAKYVYSFTLNKAFVNIFNKIPLRFKWNQKIPNLFIRALPVYMNNEYVEEPVIRCIHHVQEKEDSNKGFQYVNHVIRSDHELAVYDCNSQSGRLSVVVPLNEPQPGTDWVTVMYTFVCKNSCPSGMNRRQTKVVFTLETVGGDVLGRQIMNVRVCSCPKRDKDKEEKDYEKQNKNWDGGISNVNKKRSHPNVPNSQDEKQKKHCKRSISPVDEVYNVKVFGKTLALNTLQLLTNDLTNRAYLEERKLTPLEQMQIEECKKMRTMFTKTPVKVTQANEESIVLVTSN